MPSQIFRRGPTTPSMNLTPLIDVGFQLIIFFLLVNNIISEETVRMIVPDLEEPKTRELGRIERVVVNVAPRDYDTEDRSANSLLFDGEAHYYQVNQRRFELSELENVTADLEAYRARNPNIEVLLRADAAIYFDSVQRIMAAITDAGVEKVNLVAQLDKNGAPAD